MNFASDLFLNFWALSFGLNSKEMRDPRVEIVTSGKYVDRYGDQYIYIFKDLHTGKRILAGTKKNIEGILDKNSFLSGQDHLEGFKIVFNDTDYCLPHRDAFNHVSSEGDFRPLSSNNLLEIEEFYVDISEENKDTLDLTFQNEFVLGLYNQNSILGIARYGPLKDEPRIADITVVVRESVRGQGLSTGLVSALMEKLLSANLYPRYRVNQDLKASIAIAEKLGLRPRYRVITFEAD